MFNLKGEQPIDTGYFDFLGRMTTEQAEDDRVRSGMSILPLHPELTLQQHTAYSFLAAKMLEAEGLIGERVAAGYHSASECLLDQAAEIAMAHNMLIVMPMAKLADEWMGKAVALMKSVRGVESKDYREVFQTWEMLKRNSLIGIALQAVSVFEYEI